MALFGLVRYLSSIAWAIPRTPRKMEKTLLDLLCAPGSHAALRLASSAELEQINAGIRHRLIRNRDGFILDAELEGSLLCDAERTCYPIRDGLAVLISGEAFIWPQDC